MELAMKTHLLIAVAIPLLAWMTPTGPLMLFIGGWLSGANLIAAAHVFYKRKADIELRYWQMIGGFPIGTRTR